MRILFTFLIVMAGLTAWAEEESLQDRYFMIVWGYQGEPHTTVASHTFATFYRGEDLEAGNGEHEIISWLPRRQVIRRFRIERGHNFSLRHTLAIAAANDRNVKSWGPFEIKKELYDRAVKRVRQLESGQLKYSMLNMRSDAPNCIHAVSGIAGTMRSGTAYGFRASEMVIEHFSEYIVKEVPMD